MEKIIGIIGIAGAVVFWVLSYLSLEKMVLMVDMTEMNFVAYGSAALILWMICWIRGACVKLDRHQLATLLLSGLSGIVLYNYFAQMNIRSFGSGGAMTGIGLMPVLTLMIGMIFFDYRTSVKNILLVMMSSVGGLIVMNPFREGFHQYASSALGFMMVAGLLWGIYTFQSWKLVKSTDTMFGVAMQFLIAFVLMGLYLVYKMALVPYYMPFEWARQSENITVIGHMIQLVLFGYSGAYCLYVYALKKLGIMPTVVFINVVPLIVMMVMSASGNGALAFHHISGGLMVLVALFFIDETRRSRWIS